MSGDVAHDSLAVLSDQSANVMSLLGNVFDYAKTSSANSQGTAMQALGLASNSTAEASLSASDQAASADKSKKQMIEMAAGFGALVVIYFMFKK
jgi:hypothetical protein